MASTPGFEPAPHWWEASALTTAPPLCSNKLRTSTLCQIPKLPESPEARKVFRKFVRSPGLMPVPLKMVEY